MRSWLLFGALALCVSAFVGCDDDDDSGSTIAADSGAQGGSGGSGEAGSGGSGEAGSGGQGGVELDAGTGGVDADSGVGGSGGLTDGDEDAAVGGSGGGGVGGSGGSDSSDVCDDFLAPLDGGVCDEIPGNVISNNTFSAWDNDLPRFFMGDESNISSDNVVRANSGLCSAPAVQLINEGESHKRFTTEGMNLAAGRYYLRYYASGTGEIRTAASLNHDYTNYSAYNSIDDDCWKRIEWNFRLENPTDNVQVVFSLRNTSGKHLLLDDISLVRQSEACDSLSCNEWERCDNNQAACVPLIDRCNSASNCRDWEDCNANHECVVNSGRCNNHADCNQVGLRCDTSTHECVSGDACEGVSCSTWQTCNSQNGRCELTEGMCHTTADCLGALPACAADFHCKPATDESNVVPNGGFEDWDYFDVDYYPSESGHYLPEEWYGTYFETDPERFATELSPEFIQMTPDARSGEAALRLTASKIPSDRFTSEGFDVPAGSYTCAYYARGVGSVRIHVYSSGGEMPGGATFTEINSPTDWVRIPFAIDGNVRATRLIFYSNKTSGPGIDIDDVVCTRNPVESKTETK